MVKLIINQGEQTFDIDDLATLLKHRADIVELFPNAKTIVIQSDTMTLIIKGA